jgi:hypothetical protein
LQWFDSERSKGYMIRQGRTLLECDEDLVGWGACTDADSGRGAISLTRSGPITGPALEKMVLMLTVSIAQGEKRVKAERVTAGPTA